MTLSKLTVVQQTPQEIKHSENISRSNSNNSSQAQEFNISDVLVNNLSRNTQISKQSVSLSNVTVLYL